MANDAMNRGEISAVVIRLPSDRANHVALTDRGNRMQEADLTSKAFRV